MEKQIAQKRKKGNDPSSPEQSFDQLPPLLRGGNQAALSLLEQKEGLHAKPLSQEMSERMNRQFGVPMTGLRIYENENLNAIGETAYARGNEIHVAKGHYNPHSEHGQEVLMHEAAHVVQQGMGLVHGQEESHSLEMQAQAAQGGESIGMGAGFTMPTASAAAPIQGFGGSIKKALGKMWNGVKGLFKGFGKSKGGGTPPTDTTQGGPPQTTTAPKQSKEDKIISELGANPDLGDNEFDQLEGAMSKKSQAWQKSLNPKEQEAVQYYTSQAYRGMNRHLRGVAPATGREADNYEQQATQLSAALNKSRITSDMVLHRGVGDDYVHHILSQAGIDSTDMNFVQRWKAAKGAKGDLSSRVFEDQGFGSTSISKKVAKRFAQGESNGFGSMPHLIEYHAPKGTKGGYVEGLSTTPEEFEMLLDRGQKYRIRDIVDADELNQGSLKFIIDLINDEEEGLER